MGVQWGGGKVAWQAIVLPGVVVCTFGAGMLAHQALDDDPPVDPREIDAAVFVDATTIEMHGYGPDGKPGKFLYDCRYETDRLVCTQQDVEGDGDG